LKNMLGCGQLLAASLILSIGIFVPVQGFGVAEFGACYDASTNTITCNFNRTFCNATCVNTEAGTPSRCLAWGPTPEWKTPTQLAAMSTPVSCTCEKTHVGSCYTVSTDHVATCHLHREQCPSGTLWIQSGYRFASNSQNTQDGTYCKCHDNRGLKATQFGVCKKDISSRCSIDAGHCETGETFLDPQDALENHDIACPSYNVEVGACKASDGTTKCVVDQDS